MKTLLLAFLALAASALAQNNIGLYVGKGARETDDGRPRVDVGSLWFNEGKFKDAVATLLDSKSVRLDEKYTWDGSPSVTVAWEKLPLKAREKLAAARQNLIAEETARLAKRAEFEAKQAAGFEAVGGTILNRTPTGFLVNSANPSLIIHITGKTDKADGERWGGQCKREGLYEYTTVLGAKSTVKNYALP